MLLILLFHLVVSLLRQPTLYHCLCTDQWFGCLRGAHRCKRHQGRDGCSEVQYVRMARALAVANTHHVAVESRCRQSSGSAITSKATTATTAAAVAIAAVDDAIDTSRDITVTRASF